MRPAIDGGMKMRVLIVVGHAGIYAGGAHQALYCIMGLVRTGVEVAAVWGPDPHRDEAGLSRLRAVCPNLHIMDIHRRPTLDSLRTFRKILKDFDPDVVETFKSGAQYHCLYGGIGFNRHALLFYRGISRQMDYFQEMKYRLKRVDVVVPNCHALEEIICRSGRVNPSKVMLIYDEIDPACSDPEVVDGTGLRRELGIPEEALLVTHLGNYSPWRGQDIALRAVKILKERGLGFRMLFCGGGTENLKPLVIELGLEDRVTLSPYRHDPARVLKISDLLVNSSIGNESLSGALLNSQAMGIPAVASRMPGFDESVGDGETGKLVPVGDAVALADEMAFFLNMPVAERHQWGARAHQRAIEKFSSETRAKRRLEVYQRAIEIRQPHL
jgi:glycosyltransferase involved in cell wall biosynthesis